MPPVVMASRPPLAVPLKPAEVSFPKSKVAVTGGTGYVAGPLIERLLAAGHTVHATCRNPAGEAASTLRSLPGASERLKLFSADLLKEGDFDEAVLGCVCIMHTASPYLYPPPGEEEEKLLGPAVRGTENVLGAASRAGVKRVVLTSSILACAGDPEERGKDHVITESDWNDISSKHDNPYAYSKVLAERRAWELAEGAPWELVVVNPPMVMGPGLGTHAEAESTGMMKRVLDGGLFLWIPIGNCVIDVRDLAAAHCLCMAVQAAAGKRFLISGHSAVGFDDWGRELKPRFGKGRKLPTFRVPRFLCWVAYKLGMFSKNVWEHLIFKSFRADNSRARAVLGMDFLPVGRTLNDMAARLIQGGVVKGVSTDVLEG